MGAAGRSSHSTDSATRHRLGSETSEQSSDQPGLKATAALSSVLPGMELHHRTHLPRNPRAQSHHIQFTDDETKAQKGQSPLQSHTVRESTLYPNYSWKTVASQMLPRIQVQGLYIEATLS